MEGLWEGLEFNKRITGLLITAGLLSIILGILAFITKIFVDFLGTMVSNPIEQFISEFMFDDLLEYYMIDVKGNGLLLRPSILWPLRVLALLGGALTIAAAFIPPLSRPFIGALVVLPLLAVLPFLWIAAVDTTLFLNRVEKAERKGYVGEKIGCWVAVILCTLIFLAAALAISIGSKVPVLAPFSPIN